MRYKVKTSTLEGTIQYTAKLFSVAHRKGEQAVLKTVPVYNIIADALYKNLNLLHAENL